MQCYILIKYKCQNIVNYPYLEIDLSKIGENYLHHKKIFKGYDVFYAVKANSNIAILSTLANFDAGFEVASVAELKLLDKFSIGPEKIISSHTFHSREFIKELQKRGVKRFTIDSIEEVDKVRSLVREPQFVIRLKVDDHKSKYPLSTKFGANLRETKKIIKHILFHESIISGMMVHVGSQATASSSWINGVRSISKIIKYLEEKGVEINTINMGGGFPIEYRHKVISTQEIESLISKEFKSMKIDLKKYQMQIEPGRSIVGSAGKIYSKVISVRKGKTNYAILDIGIFNGLMEILGGFSYLITQRNKSGAFYEYSIFGPTCDSWDLIDPKYKLRELSPGDILTIHNVGAYSTEFNSNFNGFPGPEIKIIK